MQLHQLLDWIITCNERERERERDRQREREREVQPHKLANNNSQLKVSF